LSKHVLIVPLGGDSTGVFIALREFQVERVYLLYLEGNLIQKEQLQQELDKFKVPVTAEILNGPLLESMFKTFAKIKALEGGERVLVLTSSADKMGACAALSASFVNGLKAFAVENEKIMMFPVLKFSYYRLLSNKKLSIMRYLRTQPDCCASLEDLARRTKMSLALVSYHINGSAKTEGLVSEGLVDIMEGSHGRNQVILTELGKLLVDGLVESPTDPMQYQTENVKPASINFA
jgi:DNA-binding MarR family transcriptional regulator